ncbi:LOW QUALITY PROTEIN: hypothetical protein V2J09_023239 [Rumex salicifolius]
MRRWNREVFESIQNRKNEAIKTLQGIRNLIEQSPNGDLLKKEAELEEEVDLILEQEEYQKSREKWVALGDRNTTFFHSSTIIRRREDGRWEKDEEKSEDLATNYFYKLYSLEDSNVVVSLPRSRFQLLSGSEIAMLNSPFGVEEIKTAIMRTGSYKTPGPDGYQPICYHNCCGVCVEFLSVWGSSEFHERCSSGSQCQGC